MSRRPRWVYWFSDPSPEGDELTLRLLGGKGASLKRMSQAGFTVPAGFTITTEACRRFFELEGGWPDGLEQEVRENLARLEQETGRRFGQGQQPLLVSVRSGAAVSMPGMMDTLFNVGLHLRLADKLNDAQGFWQGLIEFVEAFAHTVHGVSRGALRDANKQIAPFDRATAEECLRRYEAVVGESMPQEPWRVLVAAIEGVFRSWNSPRAAAYRRRVAIGDADGTAVNVQVMFPSVVAGVLFTRDPNAPKSNRLVIESSYGLGQSVVSGDADPDRFVVSRDDLSLIDTYIGHKEHVRIPLGTRIDRKSSELSLTPQEVTELCQLGLRVESYFDQPVDVEWGWSQGRFALLQARPIRGIEQARLVEDVRCNEVNRIKSLADGTRHVWVMHDLAETLPAPTPLTWDLIRRFMSGSGGFGRMYRQLGYQPSSRVCRDGFLELIGGRIYADPARLAEMFWADMPLRYDLEALTTDRSLLERGPTRFEPDAANGRFLLMLPATLYSMFQSARRIRRLRRSGDIRFQEQTVPEYLKWVRHRRSVALPSLADDMLVAELTERCRRVLDEFGPESLKLGFAGSMAYQSLKDLLIQIAGPDEGATLANVLASALEHDITFEQGAMLYDVAHGQVSLDAFLDRFGHRAPSEMELSQPRWREDLNYLEQLIARIRDTRTTSPQEMHRANLARREAAEAELPAKLSRWGASSLRERVECDLEQTRRLLPYRELGKHYWMMGYELIRNVIEEMARRWELGRDVYFLKLDELQPEFSPIHSLRDQLEHRRNRWLALQQLDLPPVIDTNQLAEFGVATAPKTGDQLVGTSLAVGSGTGRACVVFQPDELVDVPSGCILVCPSTDPGWTPLFLSTRGLVVERGGLLSHGAIVARDFGIPAVVCANATRAIQTGDQICVDGDRGRVFILKKARPQ